MSTTAYETSSDSGSSDRAEYLDDSSEDSEPSKDRVDAMNDGFGKAG